MSNTVTDIVSRDNNQFEHSVLHAFATLPTLCTSHYNIWIAIWFELQEQL